MEKILEKLNRIKDQIVSEKTEGVLRLFTLIERNDLENKWDILFSADWLEKTNSEKDLIFLIQKLKAEFSNNLDSFAKILVATPKDEFIRKFGQAIIKRNTGKPGEISDLVISNDFTMKRAFVITINFDGINLEEVGIKEGPLGVKKVSDF